MSEKNSEIRVGLVAVCSRGRPGLITGRKELPWGESWVGVGLDDGTPWASREPKPLSDEAVYEIAARLSEVLR